MIKASSFKNWLARKVFKLYKESNILGDHPYMYIEGRDELTENLWKLAIELERMDIQKPSGLKR